VTFEGEVEEELTEAEDGVGGGSFLSSEAREHDRHQAGDDAVGGHQADHDVPLEHACTEQRSRDRLGEEEQRAAAEQEHREVDEQRRPQQPGALVL
jgi:hypothetical protein